MEFERRKKSFQMTKVPILLEGRAGLPLVFIRPIKGMVQSPIMFPT